MVEYFLVGGVSVGVYVTGKLIYDGIRSKPQPNGHHVTTRDCDKNVRIMTDNINSLKTTVIEEFKEAKEERKTLFDRVHDVRDDFSDLREKVGVLKGRTEE